ncbi:Aldo-ket-red domain-containing protein [Aphelenchoides besseyi]|nr:Aldo-ket-red domain-containing protein [Aphelenchoides besseyi]KAI6218792.1 Aldo-ket-red domain-containing protein [Aphelenchoides besseyi]
MAQIEFLPIHYESEIESHFESSSDERTPTPLIQPIMGHGTWTTPNIDELKTGLRSALDAGFRFVDTAGYFENELSAVGEVLNDEIFADGRLSRSDLFVAGKVPIHAHRPTDTDKWIKQSLIDLRTNYFDLYVLHFPINTINETKVSSNDPTDCKDQLPHLSTWRVLERHYKLGRLRSLGVANLNAQQLRQLYDHAEIKPTNLQIELHDLHPPKGLIHLCRELKITITAIAPFGSNGCTSFGTQSPQSRCLGHSSLCEMAVKHTKSTSQLLIRQLLQRGIAVIPLSTRADRIFENVDIFDFELNSEEMQKFEEMNHELQKPLAEIQSPHFIQNDVLYFTILRSLYCGT